MQHSQDGTEINLNQKANCLLTRSAWNYKPWGVYEFSKNTCTLALYECTDHSANSHARGNTLSYSFPSLHWQPTQIQLVNPNFWKGLSNYLGLLKKSKFFFHVLASCLLVTIAQVS